MCDIKHHKLCTITSYDTYCMTKSGFKHHAHSGKSQNEPTQVNNTCDTII